MNNKRVTIAVTLVFLIVGLSGCVDNSEPNRFFGTWIAIEYSQADAPLEITWTFYNNGSVKSIIKLQNNTMNNNTSLVWVDYEFDTNTLCIITDPTNKTSQICYVYEFSNNYKRFTVTHEIEGTLTFNKK